MTEIKQEETQQELFNEFSGELKKAERFPSISRPQKPILFSTSVEQIILASIILILAGCFIFFLGIIRGKFLVSKGQAVAPVRLAPLVPQADVRRVDPVRSATATLVSAKQALAPSLKVKQAAPAAVPAKTPAKPSPATLDLNKPYTIQLVTYKKKDLAEKEVAGIRRNGFYSSIIASGDYYQVCVGQYATKEEAKKDLKVFGSKYKDCFLRRR